MAEAMLPAELAEVTDPLQIQDELLTADELAELSLFEELKKTPSFARFPGTTVLRKCEKGRVLVRQGQSGATAFSILTTEDVIELRENQVKSIRRTLQTMRTGSLDETLHPRFAFFREGELKAELKKLEAELLSLKSRIKSLEEAQTAVDERRVATAQLFLASDDGVKRGLFQRLFGAKSKSTKGPAFIPIDGPADINGMTKQAPLHEGELFGEMSCMNRAPRSATVVADQDCYMLEMLRNVLDMLHNDPKYQKKLDDVYRARVLDGHVRRLPIFADLPDAEFDEIRERIELVDFPAGRVIFEEREPSDCFYLIRSGLVKIVANAWTFLREDEFKPDHWKSLWPSLVENAGDGFGEQVWSRLPESVQDAARGAASQAPDSEQQAALASALNDFIRTADLHTQLGRTTQDVVLAVDDEQIAMDCEHFPDDTKKWSELESRTFHRAILELVYPGGIPRRAATSGARRILRYMGRGEGFGELGVMTGEARSATVFAYDHPDGGANQRIPDSRTGAIPSRVELVRISRDDFRKLTTRSATLKSRVDAVVVEYQAREKRKQEAVADRVETRSQTPEFEQLGLIQGQRLMLIDLDRCTRCGQCVDACVTSHSDGRSRLYLDGPRFEKYLVPLTCRSCMDPVCMIGCPVGSINRGDNGEIQIRDWCIGCSVCADQCPYGSIQMSPLTGDLQLTPSQQALLGTDADVKSVNERAVVCDLCSSLPSREPSCVYACPHDAAMRVSALEFFFEQT